MKEHIHQRKLKVGIALGAGGALGLAHIGILKSLNKHNIYPDFIAGTSMGAVIAAMYAAGYSPEGIEETAKKTDWKKIVDFTIPKAGLIRGKLAENYIRKLLYDKNFDQLKIPLGIVAYNYSTREKVIFSKGNVTEAVRASISMPGIFAPLKMSSNYYIDGGLADPTPFDAVDEMGADFIIAVDLYSATKTVSGPRAQKGKTLMSEFTQEFVSAEIRNLEKIIFPRKWPSMIRHFLMWSFEKIIYPARVLRILSGRELPLIAKIMNETNSILTNNLAKERLKHADIDFKITPVLGNLSWSDFDRVEEFVKAGEEALEKEMPKLKKKLGI